ncbi:transporter substrate-binding domain-containing protein [Nocardioides panaciterrulae]|uniref:Polar amino acid transport system substrate-binding protein n=1 Tax=Nocardioides panaciterrulae TaxID=661492 RepID=A0A7Y9JBH0_9ACTN|nr:transporter substrate-binding domain-containing protein [Nocardioides panaciterrulae]NYD42970.1 polar amino acid transport system substrate-binding protein [Nocardioides panaciterrulae]
MVTRKLAAVAAALLTGTLSLTACSTGSSGGGSSDPGDSQLNKVLKAGELRVAVLPDFPPWAVQKADGSFEGYEIDIAHELADSLGVKLKLVSTDGDSRLPMLQSNRVDVNVSAWTSTNERAQTAGFTIPYDAHGAGVLFKKGADITSYQDLAGKSVSVARGSTNDTILTNDFPSAKPVRFDAISDVISAVKTGKVDAALESSYTVAQAAKSDPELEAISNPPLDPQLVSMGVLPGDQVWINYLNNFIRNLIASGEDNKLHEKWLGEPLASIVSVQGNAA